MNWDRFRTFLRPLFLLGGLAFFVGVIMSNWQQAQPLFSRIRWPFFALSILLAVLDNLVFSVVFHWLLQKYRLMARYGRVAEMFFLGQLAKYIPGRFWSFVYQATYFEQPRASVPIFFANLELTAVSIWRGLIIGGLLLGFIASPWSAVPLLLLGAAGFFLLMRGNWLPRLLVLLRRKQSAFETDTPARQISAAQIALAYGGTVLLYLLANYGLLVYGFQFPWSDATLFIAFFSVAWVVGVLAFVMPAGIGVREAVFVFLAAQMGSDYSLETLTTIAIIYRFWQLFHEVGAVLLGLGFRRLSR